MISYEPFFERLHKKGIVEYRLILYNSLNKTRRSDKYKTFGCTLDCAVEDILKHIKE